MKVLFFDPVSPHSYTSYSLTTRPMGASEASLMRVARSLARLAGYDVSVFQLVDEKRKEQVIDGVRHVNADSKLEPDVIVHQRTAKFVKDLAQEYPKAKHLVWMHDAAHESWLKDEPIDDSGASVICVSNWHRDNLVQVFNETRGMGPLRMSTIDPTVIYNPIELDGVERAPKIPGRLGFFSSPQKGLKQTCELLYELRKVTPKLSLVVANPGYLPDVVPEGVAFLGQLPHPAALRELSKCQVLFYPQTVFPETFGCVLAEANALGVPVLCHDFGAAKEVLCEKQNGNYVIDCTDAKNVQRALEGMLEAAACDAPRPELDQRFSTDSVIAAWKRLLEGA